MAQAISIFTSPNSRRIFATKFCSARSLIFRPHLSNEYAEQRIYGQIQEVKSKIWHKDVETKTQFDKNKQTNKSHFWHRIHVNTDTIINQFAIQDSLISRNKKPVV